MQVDDNLVFHFPPDVFAAIVDAVPLLTRGRDEVATFFQGCGADTKLVETLRGKIAADKTYSKYHATKEALTYLNAIGERGLGARRQVVRRVAEWDDYSSCYPDNQLKAKGAVAAVAQLVNKKDAFTRINLVREEEGRQHRQTREEELKKLKSQRDNLASVRSDLFALFSESNARRRGKALEAVLNRLFEASDVLVRDAFVVVSDEGAGVIEQIDGVVELDMQTYLVEMKWWKDPLGRGDVASHLVSVFSRADVGGIFISASGYHESAVEDFKAALAQRTVVMVELREIVLALDNGRPVADLLRMKIQEAKLAKQPLTFPID